MESFFSTLKSEFFYFNKFTDIEDLKTGLRRCIHYDNHQRIKLKLNRLSLVQYRAQASSCYLPTVQLLGVSSIPGRFIQTKANLVPLREHPLLHPRGSKTLKNERTAVC